MTITADSKKRVVIPSAKPGDVFVCEQQDENHISLVKLVRPSPSKAKKMTKAQVLRAIKNSKIQPTMPWDELRKLTRE